MYPYGKPCSRGTHNETMKNFFHCEKTALFSSIINGIRISVRPGIRAASNLNPVGLFSILQSSRKFYHIYTVTIVIHKSRNLIGTVGIAKVGPK